MAARVDFTNDGYDSDLEEPEPKKTWRSDPLAKKDRSKVGLPGKKVFRDEVDAAARRIGRYNGFMAMDAYSRHKQFINYYCLHFAGKEQFERDKSRDRNDYHVLAEHHRFLWDEDEDDDRLGWEKQIAKRYYDKLFKEYCIADLSLYKENRVAMRWRVEREVMEGKGQFVCGEKRCSSSIDLQSWEVNFGYVESGTKKNALVKLRLCESCSAKLNYHHKHKRAKREKKQLKKAKKRRRLEAQQADRQQEHENDGRRSASSEDDAADNQSAQQKDAEKRTEAILNSLASCASSPDKGSAESDAKKGPAAEQDDGAQVWRKPAQVEQEKSREEEFDDYFADMFL